MPDCSGIPLGWFDSPAMLFATALNRWTAGSMRWSQDLADTVTKAYFYPQLTKKEVFDGEYVATKSGHSRGSTVDLTIVDMKSGKEVDMGGTFDWFGHESHPDYGGNPDTMEYTGIDADITPEQFYNRMVLRTAMMRHGFKPLDNEWWHFTLKNEPYPDTYFNFPIILRPERR